MLKLDNFFISESTIMWVMHGIITAFIYGVFSLMRLVNADYCYQYYSCPAARYRSEKYYVECGFLNWQRCSRYRQIQYTVYQTCHQLICCPGYIGSSCSQAVCNGLTTCANGGTCSRPNYCNCRQGFSSPDCSDINECLADNGGCDHFCTNSYGSFSCHCSNGYNLDTNGKSCTDLNECLLNDGGCDHICTNSLGSFLCQCRNGYILENNGKSCTDINECLADNGGCDHFCTNSYGSFSCHCSNGYNLDTNGKSCTDLNECLLNDGGCDHICTNSLGSFSCHCRNGYNLEKNGKSCTDVNECLIANGGCDDTCINTNGSFHCQCHNGGYLDEDMVSCKGNDTNREPTVFEIHKIPQHLLPRGCDFVELLSCEDQPISKRIKLSSTSPWYLANINSSILFTFGIVFLEIDSLYLPVSLSGLEVFNSKNIIELRFASLQFTENDGIMQQQKHSDGCLSFPFTPKDIFQFISSFLPTVFQKIQTILPEWIRFSRYGNGMLHITDLRTDLVYGSRLNFIEECRGAPVQNERLYSVFRFDTNMTISLYENEVHIPAPLKGNKFCLVVDICQDVAATMYLILPPESRNLFDRFDFFETINKKYHISFRPTGIGFSISKHINVHYKQSTKELNLWNGDTVAKYNVFPLANLWLLTEVEWNGIQGLNVGITSEIFLSTPYLSKLLIGVFVDEWAGLVQLKGAATLSLTFRIFNSDVTIDFSDIVTASFDAYFSIGGTYDRSFCGDVAHPPGVFASFMISVNPFRHVPFIRDWLFDVTGRVYAFIDTNLDDETMNQINMMPDIINLKETIIRFNKTINEMFHLIKNSLNTVGNLLFAELSNNIDSLIHKIEDMIELAGSGSFDVVSITNYVTEIWNMLTRKFEHTCQEILNAFEFETENAISNMRKFIKNEKSTIRQNINLLVNSVKGQIFSISKRSGFGLKFSAFVNIAGLEFSLMDLEMVYSVERLGQCSKYRKVWDLMKDEESLKILGRFTEKRRLGFFFTVEGSISLSVAVGINSQKFIAHYQCHVSLLGMKVSTDMFISNKMLYLSLEGNIWNVFYAVISIEAEVGKQWHELRLNLIGMLTVGDGSNNFGGSYLDGIKSVTEQQAKDANKRLTVVQNGLSVLQESISAVKEKLTEAQIRVRECNTHFDNAIRSLDNAKQKLEDAKGPYLAALKRLEEAQKNVDKLCKIKTCNDICIPGVKWTRCKGRWGHYPCLKHVSCMIRIPNALCHAQNFACNVIRGLAYVALEAAKIFVRVPIMVFTAAQHLVSTTQFIVDKSRIVLVVAEGILEVAKLGLDTANLAIELTTVAIEGIKFILGAALHVFQLLITHGIQQIIDIKDCMFKLQLTTTDKSEFDVSCQIKAFGLSWHKFGFAFDFRNPVVSMWKIAKSTVTSLFEIVKDMLGKKIRRDISYASMSRLHYILRVVKRNAADANFTKYLNNSIYSKTNDVDEVDLKRRFDGRIEYFNFHCNLFMNIYSFLNESVNHLIEMTNESVTSMGNVNNFTQNIKAMKPNITSENFTLESIGISLEYAMRDYNLTEEDLENAIKDVQNSLFNDSYLNELSNSTEFAKELIDSQIEQANYVPITDHWLASLNNLSKDFFNESECVSLQDCILYSFSELYDLYNDQSVVRHPFLTKNLTSELEADFQVLILNKTVTIIDSYRLAIKIIHNLQLLEKSNLFCSEAPVILTKLPDITVLAESMVKFECITSGNPTPVVRWYQNNDLLNNNTGLTELTLPSVAEAQSGVYHCTAENMVTNVSSNKAVLIVKVCQPGTFFESDNCFACEQGFYQSQRNQQMCKACPVGFTTDKKGSQHASDCFEIDQSAVKIAAGTLVGIALIAAVLLVIWKLKLVKHTKIRPSSDIRQQVVKEAFVNSVQSDDKVKKF